MSVELRNVAGFWDGANIDEMLHVVRVQQSDELFDGVGGVADGEEDVECHSLIVAPIRLRVLKLKSRFFAHYPRTCAKERALFGAPDTFGAPFPQNDTIFCGPCVLDDIAMPDGQFD